MNLQGILDRIRQLTQIDLQHKCGDELLASTAEELGELSRELKIEFKTFGNTYKEPDEGSKAETCDLYICGMCMYYINSQNAGWNEWKAKRGCDFQNEIDSLFVIDLDYDLQRFKNYYYLTIWELFRWMIGRFGDIANFDATHQFHGPLAERFQRIERGSLELALLCLVMFKKLGGTETEFIEKTNEKLDKWARIQGL